MSINVAIEKELNIVDKLRSPHMTYFDDSVVSKRNVAMSVLQKNNEELLLIDSFGFQFDSIFSGISEKHIVYITNNGPRDYKENISKLLQNKEMINSVLEIAQAMDEDLGRGVTQNQERVKNVMQYIKDNRVAFEF